MPGPAATDAALAALAKALAHPARVRVLRLLARHDGCIGCDIVADLELAQSTVYVGSGPDPARIAGSQSIQLPLWQTR
jgi:hypothetical protein